MFFTFTIDHDLKAKALFSSAHQALTARIRNAKRLRKILVPQSDTMTAFVLTVLHFASF